MSQYDPGTIDPNTKDGATLASDINNWRDALHSSHRGATAPGYASAGMLWTDDSAGTTWELKFYDGADWISLFTIDTTANTSSAGLKNNLAASAAPTANDDSGTGYSVASNWIDTTNDNSYICVDATATSAIWKQTNISVQDAVDAVTGKQTIWVPAGTMTPLTTNGAEPGQDEIIAGNPESIYLAFDGTTAEHAQFAVAFPKGWDEGTITYQVFWTGATGTGDVVWEMSSVALANDDAISTAYGTAIEVIDSFIAADDIHVTTESTALTIAGSPGENELVYFKTSRDPAHASDTKAEDAKLLGIKLFFTLDTLKDN